MLSIEDKRGRVEHPSWLFRGFREVVDDCDLFDLQLEGHTFTWERGKGIDNLVEERIDRVLINSAWYSIFSSARLQNNTSPRTSTIDNIPAIISGFWVAS